MSLILRIGYVHREEDRTPKEVVHAVNPQLKFRTMSGVPMSLCGQQLANVYEHILFGTRDKLTSSGRKKCGHCRRKAIKMGVE